MSLDILEKAASEYGIDYIFTSTLKNRFTYNNAINALDNLAYPTIKNIEFQSYVTQYDA